jgi:hypothetical protein
VRKALIRGYVLGLLTLAAAVVPGACSDYPQLMRGKYDGMGGSAASGSGTGGSGGSAIIEAGLEDVTGGDGRIDPDAECASSVVSGDLKPANLLFVVDRSGSMNCNLPEDGQSSEDCELIPAKADEELPSKWELTEVALADAFDALETGGVDVRVGLTMFPVEGTWCGVKREPDVSIAALDATQNTELDDFLATVSPDGSTPLAGATILAYAHLYDLLAQGSLDGNVFVVLLTDGYETCKLDELEKLLGQDVPNAYNLLNFRTFVIGAPGSEGARALLSQIAWAGGTASSPDCNHAAAPENEGDCHFDMTMSTDFAADLADTLEQISGTVLTCELDVPSNPDGGAVDYDKVNVDVNDQPISPTDCSVEGANGWEYFADRTRIRLCGEACDLAMQENATVSIVLGCPTRPPE